MSGQKGVNESVLMIQEQIEKIAIFNREKFGIFPAFVLSLPLPKKMFTPTPMKVDKIA